MSEQEELERLRKEVLRLQGEVVNRNKRALDGDEYKAAFDAQYDMAEQLRAENAALKEEAKNQEMQLMCQYASDVTSQEYWRGHNSAVAGVAKRWEEALTEPIPKAGIMSEPLESLYRRTEALRQKGVPEGLKEADDALHATIEEERRSP